MKDEQAFADLLQEMLTQVSLELEASARAAKDAAGCISDKRALWTNIQQMYARFNQANYFLGGLPALPEGAAAKRRAGDEADGP